MLFGYLSPPQRQYPDDVQCSEASLECFVFDRPLLLSSELHVAGAMAFATTFGFAGISLIEWAFIQSMESYVSKDTYFEEATPQEESSSDPVSNDEPSQS